jgi:hypothetical protein
MKRALLVLLPFTIIYAIVSSIGAPGNHYGPPSSAGVSYQGLPQANGK